VADRDFFAISLPAVADLRLETFDGNGPGGCAGVDTVIALFAPDGVTQLVSDDQDGINSCSKIDSVTDVAARHLSPGTYFVRVEDFANDSVIPGYTLRVTLNALCGDGAVEGAEECDGGAACAATCDRIPLCGDGLVDAPELCDDGGAANGDGCDASCQVEGAVAEAEPNNSIADADARALGPTPIVINADVVIAGAITDLTDEKDLFRVEVAAPSVVRFETFDSIASADCGATTTTLRLFNAGGTQIATDPVGGATAGIRGCAALVVNLAAGVFYIQIEETGTNANTGTYRLEVNFQSNAGAELEDNGALATANPLGGSDVFILGGHQVGADIDVYEITVPAGASVRAEIIEGDAELCEGLGVDSRLKLLNAAGVELVSDDDDGRGFCSLIDGTGTTPLDAAAHNLAGGTFFLQVEAENPAGGAGAQFDYRLVVTIRQP
jgi:cysteine-rich repeat protein